MPVWINEMASFMKELDPNHLVTSGGEGFWGADNKRADNNPQMPASRSARRLSLLAVCWLQPAAVLQHQQTAHSTGCKQPVTPVHPFLCTGGRRRQGRTSPTTRMPRASTLGASTCGLTTGRCAPIPSSSRPC
jgi:hypothetical protein